MGGGVSGTGGPSSGALSAAASSWLGIGAWLSSPTASVIETSIGVSSDLVGVFTARNPADSSPNSARWPRTATLSPRGFGAVDHLSLALVTSDTRLSPARFSSPITRITLP